MNTQRRDLIRYAAGAAAATLGVPAWGAAAAGSDGAAGVDVHIELQAVADRVSIRPGAPTRVWRYRGRLLRGDAGVLDEPAGSYLGPIIRVRRGQRVRIDLINALPESTITHWHGLHVPETMDGHPRHAIATGERYVYAFTVTNRAGSYWFHPHPHGRTGKQVYLGLAGLFLVGDDEEAGLDLPSGRYDMPLVLQDRSFDNDNQFVYPADAPGAAMGGGMMGGGMGRMMARMMGVLGNEILVNGRAAATLSVERRPCRLRLFNASNTRMYKLAWHDQSPLTVIGTDGGLLAAPLQRDYVMLAPAERLDLWVDFRRWPRDTELTLQSLAFDDGMTMIESSLPDGAPFRILQLRVEGGAAGAAASPPQRLSDLGRAQPRVAVNFGRPKVFELTMGMMVWGINGRSFEMLAASPLETVKLGTHEVWEFRNDAATGMMGMTMPHSMHVHGVQFRVIGRTVASGASGDYDTVKAGFVDEGWKDTVLVMPGERVRILLGFADYPGLFLYHCHMLEHEDTGLMRNYLVKA